MESNEIQETQALELVKVDAADYGLQATEAATVEAVFLPMIKAMTDLEDEFNTVTQAIITPETTRDATALRMRYVKIRTGTAEIHKKAKAYYLAGGRFIDGWKNAQAFASQGKEKALQDIEMHFINIEAARIAALYESRKKELFKCAIEGIPMMVPPELGYMPEDVFTNYLEGTKIAHTAKLKRIQDEQAEADRIQKEEQDRREALRIENENLKKEREEQNRLHEAERMEAQKKQQAIEDKARSERLKAEAERKELQAKIDKDAEEVKRQQIRALDINTKLEKEKQEAISKIERMEAERAANAMPIQEKTKAKAKLGMTDRELLKAWILNPSEDIPTMYTNGGRQVAADIEKKYNGFKRWALNEASVLR